MRLSILISFSGRGGVEVVVSHLVNGFIKNGYDIDLIHIKKYGNYLENLSQKVNIVDLKTRHAATSLFSLCRYLKANKPHILIVSKHKASVLAAIAKLLTGYPHHLIIRLDRHLSYSIRQFNTPKKWIRLITTKLFYSVADKVVGVSKAVTNDFQQLIHFPNDKLLTIYNAVVDDKIFELAQEPIKHPWFNEKTIPIILAAGRLTKVKDFQTLLLAFKQLYQRKECRLVILGEGPLRGNLISLANTLNIANFVWLPGFVENPYAYMSKAKVFVLSSISEGFGNVLVEAMAVGTPVVTTNCLGGPIEIVQNGKYGKIVEVGNVEQMTNAILDKLSRPQKTEELLHYANRYHIDMIIKDYVKIFQSISHA